MTTQAAQTALQENLAELESSTLPAHLKAMFEKQSRAAAALGFDPNSLAKSLQKAHKNTKNDFHPIHAIARF